MYMLHMFFISNISDLHYLNIRLKSFKRKEAKQRVSPYSRIFYIESVQINSVIIVHWTLTY